MPLPWGHRLPVARPAHPAVQLTPALPQHRARILPAVQHPEHQALAWEAPPDLAAAAALAVAVAVVASAVAAVAAVLAVVAPGAVALAVATVVEAVPSAAVAHPSVVRPSSASPAKAPKHPSRNIRSRSTITSGSSSTTQWKTY